MERELWPTWDKVVEDFKLHALELGLEIEKWPIFRQLPILPHGIEPEGYKHATWPLSAIVNWPKPNQPCTVESYLHSELRTWPVEVVTWWLSENATENIGHITHNTYPNEHRGELNFDGTHVTKSAMETCASLWAVRQDLSKVLAVLILAWAACELADRKGGSFRQSERWPPGGMDTLHHIVKLANGHLEKNERPYWHHAGTRMLPDREIYDPITVQVRAISNRHVLLKSILWDSWISQTRAHLVQLIPDPNFVPDEYRKQAAEERRLAQEEREREEIRSKDRRAATLQALQLEAARRQAASSAYAQAGGIDFGEGVLTADQAAKTLSVPSDHMQSWIRWGLSPKQIRFLASGPVNSRAKKAAQNSINTELAQAEMIPGVERDQAWTAEYELSRLRAELRAELKRKRLFDGT